MQLKLQSSNPRVATGRQAVGGHGLNLKIIAGRSCFYCS